MAIFSNKLLRRKFKTLRIVISNKFSGLGKIEGFPAKRRVGDDRASWEAVFNELFQPLYQAISRKGLKLRLRGSQIGYSGAHCDTFEAVARSFLIVAIISLTKNMEKELKTYKRIILQGIDPESRYYWGKIDSSQILVENASLAAGILLMKEKLNFSKDEQTKLIEWFSFYSRKEYPSNNWQWFLIFHLLFLESFEEHSRKREILRAFKKIRKLYVGGGWFTDGFRSEGAAFDYYNVWGMHLFGLLFTIVVSTQYDEMKRFIRETTLLFHKTYRHFLTPNGTPPFYGRSLSYRFASLCTIGLGVVTKTLPAVRWFKRAAIDTMNSFLDERLLTKEGFLMLGYCRGSRKGIEIYAGAGSAYWSLMAFTILLIRSDHQFWKLKTQSFKPKKGTYVIPETGQVLSHDGKGGVLLLNGSSTRNDYPIQYNKFAYSNSFLFDIDNKSLTNAFLFKKNLRWVMRGKAFHTIVKKNSLEFSWFPIGLDCRVKTKLIPVDGGYCAEHTIFSPSKIHFRIGGFTLVGNLEKVERSGVKIILFVDDHKSSIETTNLKLTFRQSSNNPSEKRSFTPFCEGVVKGRRTIKMRILVD